jgi:hypothetical protein
MTPRRQATQRAFTLIMCTACTSQLEVSVLDDLRAAIRRCTNGMLVTTACMLGPLTCAARAEGPGAMVLLQPCTNDRRPVGPARWIGPITGPDDATELCGWVEHGEWDLGTLPRRLQTAPNWTPNWTPNWIPHAAGQN